MLEMMVPFSEALSDAVITVEHKSAMLPKAKGIVIGFSHIWCPHSFPVGKMVNFWTLAT
jgi:hypothetical protein